MFRVKQLKDLELAYDAASGMSVDIYTDMPGSTLTKRATLTFPASTGRRTYTAPLDTAAVSGTAGSPLEGTLYMLDITSTGVARLFGGKIRVRAIGVYIDGANSERFRTQPTGIGI